MDNIVILDSDSHSNVIIDIIEKMNQYHKLGLIEPIREVETEALGYKVLGNS